MKEVNVREEQAVLERVLRRLKLDDISISYSVRGELNATDAFGNTWKGKELYNFLIDEVFVYDEEHGGVVGIRNELLDKFIYYSIIRGASFYRAEEKEKENAL